MSIKYTPKIQLYKINGIIVNGQIIRNSIEYDKRDISQG